jgi:tetratricopeptide (TPR) repeat protein
VGSRRRGWLLIAASSATGGLLTSLASWVADLRWLSAGLAVIGAVLATVSGTIAVRPEGTVGGAGGGVGDAPRVWALPRRLAHFTGRATDLEKIEAAHARGRRPDVAIIWGIGGVGKTSLGLEYAHRVEGSRGLVAWIQATERPAVVAGLAELGRELGFTGDDQDSVVRRTLAGLDRRAPWLLIYDDATPETVEGLLPTAGDGNVLITSRDSQWTHIGTTIELAALPEDDAVALVLERSQDRSADAPDQARELVQRLGCLPLAVDLAGAYCHDTCTIGEYRRLLLQTGLALLRNRQSGIPAAGNEIAARLSVDRIAGRDKGAAELLHLLAWFAPGYLPQATITAHADLLPRRLRVVAADTRRWHESVGRLHAAGLIRAEPGLLWIHQLVQEVQRDRLKTGWWGVRSPREWKTIVLQVVTADFPNSHEDISVWPHCAALLPHATALLDDPDLPQAFLGPLADNVINYHHTRGQDQTARDLSLRTLQARTNAFGPRDRRTLAAMNSLAAATYGVGDYAATRDIYRQAIEISRELLGPEDPGTLSSMSYMAVAMNGLGEYYAVRDLHQQTLEIRTRVLGPEHPDTAVSMSNLGNALNGLGDNVQARDLHQRALDIRSRIFGPEHPTTLISMNNLGNALNGLGEHEAARVLHQRTADLCRKVLGADHPDTLASVNNLAVVINDLGDHATAREMHASNVDNRSKALGPEHPYTMRSLNNLANAIEGLSDHAAARDLYQKIVDTRGRVLGPEHPYTLRAMNNLAVARYGLGEQAESHALHEKTLEIRQRVLGPDHPDTRTSEYNLSHPESQRVQEDESNM